MYTMAHCARASFIHCAVRGCIAWIRTISRSLCTPPPPSRFASCRVSRKQERNTKYEAVSLTTYEARMIFPAFLCLPLFDEQQLGLVATVRSMHTSHLRGCTLADLRRGPMSTAPKSGFCHHSMESATQVEFPAHTSRYTDHVGQFPGSRSEGREQGMERSHSFHLRGTVHGSMPCHVHNTTFSGSDWCLVEAVSANELA